MLARWEQTITDEAGNRIDQPTVRVEREVAGLPLAVLKSDIDGASPLSNPFTPAAGVDPFFHTQGGFFKITITKGAYSKVLRYVALGTAAALDTPPLSDAGVWDSGTDYVPGQTVQHDGSSYWALVESTAVEPGVTSGWESSWSLLAQAGTDGAAVPTTGLEFPEQSSAPATPSAGTLLVYAKDDQQLYKKDSAGNETKVGAGGGAVLPQGRLTLTTAVPVLTSPVAAATVIYYTPYVGNLVPIYDGAALVNTEFAELSNDLTASSTGKAGPAAATTNSNYDLFVWNDAGTIRLTRGPLWSSSTARGTGAGTTELERVKGVLLNKQDITNGPAAQRGTYVGTVRTNGSSQVDFNLGGAATAANIGLWNAYNRVLGAASVQETTDSWAYTSTTYRQLNNSANNQISVISGLSEDEISVAVNAFVTNTTGGVVTATGVGINSTTVNSAQLFGGPAISNTVIALSPSSYRGSAALGWGVYAALESSQATGTTTWWGDSPAQLRSGMQASFTF
jgi:hypothetical protein